MEKDSPQQPGRGPRPEAKAYDPCVKVMIVVKLRVLIQAYY